MVYGIDSVVNLTLELMTGSILSVDMVDGYHILQQVLLYWDTRTNSCEITVNWKNFSWTEVHVLIDVEHVEQTQILYVHVNMKC